jgi:hypothetical protein
MALRDSRAPSSPGRLYCPFLSRCDARDVAVSPSFDFCTTLDEKDEQI